MQFTGYEMESVNEALAWAVQTLDAHHLTAFVKISIESFEVVDEMSSVAPTMRWSATVSGHTSEFDLGEKGT